MDATESLIAIELVLERERLEVNWPAVPRIGEIIRHKAKGYRVHDVQWRTGLPENPESALSIRVCGDKVEG